MRKDPMPLGLAIGMLIVGVFLGSIFSFGMQFWNRQVTREECTRIQTQFSAHQEVRKRRRPLEIEQILVTCTNGERYTIDGVSVNKDLRNELSALEEGDAIILLIHPNSDTIVEFSCQGDYLLQFEDTIRSLGNEATGFMFLGIFMYACALLGLYYTVLHIAQMTKEKRRKIK